MRWSSPIILCVLGFSLCVGEAINISGVVTEGVSGRPLQWAFVKLASSNLTDTTDASGAFSFASTGLDRQAIPRPAADPQVSGAGGGLVINLDEAGRVSISGTAVDGREAVRQEAALPAGQHRFGTGPVSAAMILYRIRAAGREYLLRQVRTGSAGTALRPSGFRDTPEGGPAKGAANFVDKLVTSKAGYVTKTLPISSATATGISVVLEIDTSAPAAPEITLAPSSNSVVVRWDPVPGASSYNLYYAPGEALDPSRWKVYVGVRSPSMVSDLTLKTQYAFGVTALRGARESLMSSLKTVTLDLAVLTRPVISSVVAGDGSVTVSWDEVSGATTYSLYYRKGTTVSSSTGTRVDFATSPQSVTNLDNGAQYAFALSAANGDGESPLSEVKTATPQLVDIDGNTYHTVKIGKQVWMVENLRTSRLNDGTTLATASTSTAWAALEKPAFCTYENNAGNLATYGALYNWYAVNSGKLAPTSYHVASAADWNALTKFLGGDTVAGGKLKEAGITHWLSPNEDASNLSGFKALPGGFRSATGTFGELGSSGYWWCAGANQATTKECRILTYGNGTIAIGDKNAPCALSVRCLKN